MSDDLITLLRSIVSDYLNGAMGVRAPDANFITNELLKNHLMEGFMVDNCFFDVVVFAPKSNKGKSKVKGGMRRHRSFYKIVERHPGYNTLTLKDL